MFGFVYECVGLWRMVCMNVGLGMVGVCYLFKIIYGGNVFIG